MAVKGLSSIHTTLSWGTDGTTYGTTVEVSATPDLGGTPQMIEVTTLNDAVQVNVPGVQQLSSLDYTFNFTPENYKKVADDANKQLYYKESEGENGEYGTFTWQGMHTVKKNGDSVNGKKEAVMSIAASSAPVFTAPVGG